MTSIPSNLARVPNLLTSQVILGGLQRSSLDLINTQVQLSSGRRINRASDDAVAASSLGALDDLLERRDQRLRNLDHATSVLGNLDSALSGVNDILIEAKGLGLSQIGVGSDAATRKNQAGVVDAMIQELLSLANSSYQDIHLFAGSASGTKPFESLLGGIKYSGSGKGLVTDTGLSAAAPITISGVDAFGALSARVRGERDLDPSMTATTRLADLNGARGTGVSKGSLSVTINAVEYTLDLSEADTVGDVITDLEALIQTVDAGAAVSIDPATGDRLRIAMSAGNTVSIADPGGAAGMAADMGLVGVYPPGVTTVGQDVDPRVTELTAISSLSGVTVPMGTIRLVNAGQTRDLDLSGAQTVQDIINAVKGLDIGVRVEIDEAADRLNFVNELSGASMSIGELGGLTATELGVRSYTAGTLLSDFNDGLGVENLAGYVDPVSGLPDPTKDVDFRITARNGTQFDVDLPAGAQTVQDVLDAINAAAAGAGLLPAQFEAVLAANGNGIEVTDNTAGASTVVASLNGSHAAENLGLEGTWTSATFVTEDRAKVAVDGMFAHLIQLRDALLANDEVGIGLATGKLDADIARATEARATVGVRAQRVGDAAIREEDLKIQDVAMRSELRDLDYTEASIRFASLQQQLQAGLASASQATSLSLLDFLG
jgi:flagellar hook-associated protein 3 FlgL